MAHAKAAKPNLLLLSKYDVTQKIIETLSNVCSRAILFSIRDEAKDAGSISAELELSLSAVYTTLRRLEVLALVEKRYELSDRKKIKLYRSRINRAEILMDSSEPELKLFTSNHTDQVTAPG